MRTRIFAIAGAAAALVWAVPAPARPHGGGQAGTSMQSSTVQGQSGQATSDGLQAYTLDAYVQARKQIEQRDPQLAAAIASGPTSVPRGRLESALQGTPLTADQFAQLHRQVQSRPDLRARVESQLGAAGGAAAGTAAAAPGASGAPASFSEETLQRYVRARQEIEPQMSADEFVQVHQAIQRDPSLRSRVEQQLGTSGAGGPIEPGQQAPLPSGGLGVGPAAGTGQTPPGTQRPGLGTGAPTTSQPNGQGAGDGSGGGSSR